MIAIPIYVLFPVAPPRLADVGLIDTVSQQSGVGLSGRSTMFYNPLAAVPSLHVGFATAIGIAVAAVLHRPWTKLAAAMWGPTVALAVVATGNHFVFDIAAGLAVTLAGVIAAAAPGYLRRRRPTPARADKAAAEPRAGSPGTANTGAAVAPVGVLGQRADRGHQPSRSTRPKRAASRTEERLTRP